MISLQALLARHAAAHDSTAAKQRFWRPAPHLPRQRHWQAALCTAELPGSNGNGASNSAGWLLDASASRVRADYDAIMVLGGGLLADGGLPPWVERRLDGALHIYSQQQGARCPVVLLGAGTPHKRPVLDSAGFVLHESTAYASYLIRHGVPPSDLLKETSSYDTVGNAYFSATIHAAPAGWRRMAVVTSDFHMPRTSATFDDCYALAGRHLASDAAFFSLDYHPVSDAGLFADGVLAARVEKEAAAVAAWRGNMAKLGTLPELHAWLFATHLCYSVSRQHEFGREQDLDPRLAATY